MQKSKVPRPFKTGDRVFVPESQSHGIVAGRVVREGHEYLSVRMDDLGRGSWTLYSSPCGHQLDLLAHFIPFVARTHNEESTYDYP